MGYIHVLKAAGMAIKAFLKIALCGTIEVGFRKPPCPGGRDVLDIVSCRTAIQEHPTFFTWSFVRNPFSRMYSAYAMGMAMPVKWKSTAAITFGDFATNVALMQKQSRTSPDHWEPQVSFVLSENGCPVVDFVGKLENLNIDMWAVLEIIGSAELIERFNSHGLPSSNSTNFGEKLKDRSSKAKSTLSR